MGMSYDEYWKQDPYLVVYYREKFKEEQKNQNRLLWLQGAYFYEAITVAMSNAFGKHKQKYSEKPYDVFEKTEKEKRIEAKEARDRLVKRLQAFKDAWDRNNQ